jgi:ubiquinone/menaquinone biosynthesis C-methylase UbiE
MDASSPQSGGVILQTGSLRTLKKRILIERIPAPFASLYEKATRMVIESYYGPVAEEIVASLKTGTILDLGTGPGYLPIEIVKRSSSIRVIGIDLTRKLINTAKLNALKNGVAGRLHFEVGNAARLRFEDNYCDRVISTGMLHSLKDPVMVLRECYRVLKPGGEAWIYDPAKVSSHIDANKWKASFTRKESFLYSLFLVFNLYNKSHIYNRMQVIEIIKATAFDDYEIEEEKGELKIKLKKGRRLM